MIFCICFIRWIPLRLKTSFPRATWTRRQHKKHKVTNKHRTRRVKRKQELRDGYVTVNLRNKDVFGNLPPFLSFLYLKAVRVISSLSFKLFCFLISNIKTHKYSSAPPEVQSTQFNCSVYFAIPIYLRSSRPDSDAVALAPRWSLHGAMKFNSRSHRPTRLLDAERWFRRRPCRQPATESHRRAEWQPAAFGGGGGDKMSAEGSRGSQQMNSRFLYVFRGRFSPYS